MKNEFKPLKGSGLGNGKPYLVGIARLFLCAAILLAGCDNPQSGGDTDGSTGPLTAEVSFSQTGTNTAQVSFDTSAWRGDGTNAETWGLGAQEKPVTYFAITKIAAQTITAGGTDGALVTQPASADGSSASATLSIFAVDTNGAWLKSDGSLSFTLLVQEPGHSSKLITVKLSPSLNLNAGVVIYKVNANGTLSTDLSPAPNLGTEQNKALDKAFRWVDGNCENNTEYLLRVNQNQIMPKDNILCAGKDYITIRLRGAGGERNISRDTGITARTDSLNQSSPRSGGLIYLGNETNNMVHITLKLERNITIDGKGEEITSSGVFNTIKMRSLLSANWNCTIILDAGSKVTGYKGLGYMDFAPIVLKSFNATASTAPVIRIMRGAQISGNAPTSTNSANGINSLVTIDSGSINGAYLQNGGMTSADLVNANTNITAIYGLSVNGANSDFNYFD